MSIKTILFLLFGYLSIQHSLAQSPYFRQITDLDGLPSMTVYDIYQSKKGYIWLGTGAGICRYDGVRFQTYTVDSSLGKSFAGIQEDSEGNIYFVNFVGQLFRLKNETIEQISLPKDISKKYFNTYLIDEKDNIWLGVEKLYLKNKNSLEWQILDLENTIRLIQKDTKGRIWILTYHNHIYQVSSNLKIKRHIKAPEGLGSISVSDKAIQGVSLNENIFYEYSFDTKKWIKIWQGIEHQIPDRINKVIQGKKNNFWIATFEGLLYYQPNTNQSQLFLGDKFISDILQDYEGNLWFASLGQGLFVLPSLEGLHFNRNNSALNFEQINCLEEDDLGNLYIGTNGNQLFYLDTKKQALRASYQLPIGDVECLLFDTKSQRLYVENNIVQVFDTKKKAQVTSLKLGNTPKSLAIYQDDYLISVAGDISVLYALKPNLNTPKFGRVHHDNASILARKRGRKVCVDNANKRFWVAYADGLYCYQESGALSEIQTPDNQAIIAISLQLDEEGVLWVGTTKNGVFAIRDNKIIKHLTQKNGLVSDFCRVVREKGFLYIGTDKGLQVYHIKTGQSRIFNQEDGLPSNEIKDLIVQKDKIYLATNKGVSVLNKDFSTTNHKAPLIYLTGFEVWDKAQKLAKAYHLAYNENNLTLRFTGLAFRSGGKFRYKYRMQGLDKKWTYSESSSSFARYSALPSGSYQFEVKAINEDGIESKEIAMLNINIAYPIWEKWWFISLIILLSLGIITAIVFTRLRAIRRKTEMEKALGKATLESLKLQMNPHFLFNAMSAIQRYMLRNDAPQASNYLARFSKLMRAILENSRSEYISLADEIEMLENYLALQKLQHAATFEYKIVVGKDLDAEEIAIPPMFAQPFIENAIEHGIADLKKGGFIEINFDLEDKFVILKIQDNGIGLEKSQAMKAANNAAYHQSLATQITQERINLYKKSLGKHIIFEIKSNPKGTEVVFQLPFLNL